MSKTVSEHLDFFCWLFFRRKAEGKTRKLKPVIYNYLKYDEETKGYLYAIFTNFDKLLDYGAVSTEDMTRDELLHALREEPKPVYYDAFGANYEVVTVVEGEGDYPPGFEEAKKVLWKHLSMKEKVKKYFERMVCGVWRCFQAA